MTHERHQYGPGLYMSLADAAAIYNQVSAETGVALDILLSETRAPKAVRARRKVMAAMRDRGASNLMIAKRMLMDPSSVHHGLKRWEQECAA